MDLSLPIPKGRRDLSGLKLRDSVGGQCTLDECLQVLLYVSSFYYYVCVLVLMLYVSSFYYHVCVLVLLLYVSSFYYYICVLVLLLLGSC